jgi:UDP-hydrolysing UDP-N-acetyl-D-glucosamine 2-epimerase
MSPLRIAAVSGTRADYGILRPVLRGLRDSERFDLRMVVTGTHLAQEFGRTVAAIEADGFRVDEAVEMLLSSDTPVGVTTSMGLATIGMAGALDRLAPDLLLVLGDRYEILAAVQAALVARIPVAHLSGGDVTEGAIDDAMRHAITKLSHLHFPTNEGSAARIRQLGEDPGRVIVAGSPGLDDLVSFEPMPATELARDLGLELREQNVLVTYHPVTLADEPPARAGAALVAALEALGDEVGIVITLPNADTGGRVLIEQFRSFAEHHDHVVAHESLGQARYWSCMKTFDAVVGNSSSGLAEAPVAGIAAVDIGERQRGRAGTETTIHCAPERDAILAAVRQALATPSVPSGSFHGDGHATGRILEALAAIDDPRALLVKRFHEG